MKLFDNPLKKFARLAYSGVSCNAKEYFIYFTIYFDQLINQMYAARINSNSATNEKDWQKL